MAKSSNKADEFKTWLDGKLKDIGADADVFGSYIMGILDGDETPEEKRDALLDVLGEIGNDLAQLITLIMEKWQAAQPKEEDIKKPTDIDVNEQLAKLLESQKLQTTVKDRQYTEEERRIREQILAQYSQTEVDDVDAYEPDADGEGASSTTATGGGGLGGIERNTNVQDVMQLQKEKREQARMDSAAKKQKDKEDRERQKQLREEKKEKRKTVKGERRR